MNIENAGVAGILKKIFPQESVGTTLYLFVILLLYSITGIVGMIHHEMWRDEIEPWLIASVSESLLDFFKNMKMGSNPYVWYLILHFLSKITLSTGIVQIAHLLVAMSAVYLVLRFSPFSVLQKALLCFGYYLLFEYGIISRGYALTIFFIFLFCVLYKRYWANAIPLAVVIFFLANATGGFGAILSISFLMFLIADYMFGEMSDGKKKQKIKNFGWTVALIIFSIWVAIKSISPPEDSIYADMWFKQVDSARMFSILWRVWIGYVPIPDIGAVNFWNSNILASADPRGFAKTILTVSSLFFILFGALFFAKRLSVVVFFLAGTFGVLFFSYLNGAIFIINGARYNGFMFLVFIVSYWLLSYYPEKRKSNVFILTRFREKLKVDNYGNLYVTLLLVVGFAGSVIAYSKDFIRDFSSVERAGRYIMEHGLDRYRMAGMVDYAVSPISAYTRKPIYYPERNASSTFPIWSAKNYSTDNNENIRRLLDFMAKQNDTVLMVFNFDLNTSMIGDVHFDRLAQFNGSIVADENFSVYRAAKYNLENDLRNFPSNPTIEELTSYVNLMSGFLQQGKIQDCEKILSRIYNLASGKNIPRFHNVVGTLHLKKNLFGPAKEEFQKEIALGQSKEEAYFQLGMAHYQGMNMDSARISWEEVIKLNQNNIDALSNLGIIAYNFSKDYVKAEEMWSRAIKVNPRYTQMYVNLMMNCQTKKDENCLLNYLKTALVNGMSVEDIRSKGIAISDRQLEKAQQ